jgi:CCR4-NOT transcription complex subunit 1
VGHANRADQEGSSRAPFAPPPNHILLTRYQLVDSNGMEVFSKYFRRVLQNNAATIFGTGARNGDPTGSYQILLTEVHKIRNDAEQADKIAESISSNEGDLFRDFDLATFISHFKLDSIAKTMLALACRKTELRSKGTSSYHVFDLCANVH